MNTNTIILTNFTEITNIITAISTSNWEKTSTIATIFIPIILTIWAWYSEKRKDERKQQQITLEKSQEQEKQKRLYDLEKIQEFIDTELIPESSIFLDSQDQENFQRIYCLKNLVKTWEKLVKLSQNTVYEKVVLEEYQKAHQELNKYYNYLSQGLFVKAIPCCISELDKLYEKIKDLKLSNKNLDKLKFQYLYQHKNR